MAIKGSLKEASLADVCQLLALGMKTGCLSITDRSRFGQIFFDRGRITYARVINRRDRLGDLVVRDGMLTQSQLDDVLELQSQDLDRRVGELLVDRGFLTGGDLTRYVRLQIEEAIFHLFTWSRGSFYFEADQRPQSADILVSINPESLLLEAARRVDEWCLIEKKVPSLDLIFEVERDRVLSSEVELTAEQRSIVMLLDGSRTVQDLVDDTGLTEFEVGKALYGLIQAGFAHRVGRRSEESPRTREGEVVERRNLGTAFYRTGMMEDAVREFSRVLELDPRDDVSRFFLGLISIRDGRPRDAVRQFKALLEDAGPSYAAYVNLAYALRTLRRTADAMLVLDEAEALRPGTPIVALARALTQLDAGDAAGAESGFAEYCRRLPAGTPPGAPYFYYAALSRALRRDLAGAQALIDEGLVHHAESALLLLLRGLVLERQGEVESAERWYRAALEEHSLLAQGHKNLGDIAYRRGNHDDALVHYRRAAELEPELGDDVYARIGNILYKSRDYVRAIQNWKRALELNPKNQVVRNNLEIVAHVVR